MLKKLLSKSFAASLGVISLFGVCVPVSAMHPGKKTGDEDIEEAAGGRPHVISAAMEMISNPISAPTMISFATSVNALLEDFKPTSVDQIIVKLNELYPKQRIEAKAYKHEGKLLVKMLRGESERNMALAGGLSGLCLMRAGMNPRDSFIQIVESL